MATEPDYETVTETDFAGGGISAALQVTADPDEYLRARWADLAARPREQRLRVHADISAFERRFLPQLDLGPSRSLLHLRLTAKAADAIRGPQWDALGALRGLKVLQVDGGGRARACLFESMLKWATAERPMALERLVATVAMGRRVIKCRSQYESAQKQIDSYVPSSTVRLRSALNDFTADG